VWNTTLSENELLNHYKRGILTLNMSYRTSNDNSVFTDWAYVINSTLSLVNARARYFQYRANLTTADVNYTPYLENVTINYSIQPILKIFDDTDTAVRIVNQIITFTANFTDAGGISINGSGVNCTFSHNLTGTFLQLKT